MSVEWVAIADRITNIVLTNVPKDMAKNWIDTHPAVGERSYHVYPADSVTSFVCLSGSANNYPPVTHHMRQKSASGGPMVCSYCGFSESALRDIYGLSVPE
jgi:hypothetical protein